MTKTEYDREMLRAKTIRQSEPDKEEYYAGYMCGLRIAYKGGGFGVDREHNRWMKLIYNTNAKQHARGQGYRDGLLAAA
jgi:hypothetical protein